MPASGDDDRGPCWAACSEKACLPARRQTPTPLPAKITITSAGITVIHLVTSRVVDVRVKLPLNGKLHGEYVIGDTCLAMYVHVHTSNCDSTSWLHHGRQSSASTTAHAFQKELRNASKSTRCIGSFVDLESRRTNDEGDAGFISDRKNSPLSM
jgi:hypothetical protein